MVSKEAWYIDGTHLCEQVTPLPTGSPMTEGHASWSVWWIPLECSNSAGGSSLTPQLPLFGGFLWVWKEQGRMMNGGSSHSTSSHS